MRPAGDTLSHTLLARARHVAASSSSPSFEYGFHVQSHRDGAATVALLRSIRTFYRREAIFLATDDCRAGGGLNYTRACRAFACVWTAYPSAAGHCASPNQPAASGLEYLLRVERSMLWCDCTFLVTVETDTCLVAPINVAPPTDGVVGGFPWVIAPPSFVVYAANASGVPKDSQKEAVFGCSAGCYYRTRYFARLRVEKPDLWSVAAMRAAQHAGALVQCMDVVGPAVAMLGGRRVRPWDALNQTMDPGVRVVRTVGYKRGAAPWKAVLVHKCDEQVALRRSGHDAANKRTTVARDGGGRKAADDNEQGALLWEECRGVNLSTATEMW